MSRIDSANPYRLQSPVTSFTELAKTKPTIATPMPEEFVAELKLHEEQVAARIEASYNYGKANPDQIYAQVSVGGKVVATVYESGITSLERGAYGTNLTEDGAGLDLAKARLADIMEAVEGEVRFSDFEPQAGWVASNIPELVLPKVTARGLVDLWRAMDWDLARSRMGIDDAAKAEPAG
ncbi:hypothetical protein [Telluria beijingensis]|uniref:hypothetical protein n=1 Tax=Telluria beijingensis TaxID=3068633 RepID=UPI00279608B0|nr:hypothetical protein [Massilia sp. REN29]